MLRPTTATVLVLALALLPKELLAAQVDVTRKELLVLPGQNATFMCRVSVPLQYCRMELPGNRAYNLNKGSINNYVSYYGEGLEAGQCGFTIHRVEEKDNGNIKCTLGIPSEPTESIGTMQLIVAKAPLAPELDLSKGTDSLRVYQAGDQLEASCVVRDGRPVANITWFLNDDQINDNSLKMPTVVDLAKQNLQSKVQNLTKTLLPSDNGKFLRCVATHPAYPGGFAETKRQLDVKFAPPAKSDLIDRFGYQIGKVGLINVTLEANPKPHIDWSINGERIVEGSTDRTGRIEAEHVVELGRGKYLANLRIAAIKKEDTEHTYVLRAYNDLGMQEYKVMISTSAEPEGLEQVGLPGIIGIVVAVLFIILVFSLLIFAKVTGRWCFSVAGEEADMRNIGESSDTESADLRPKETKRKLPPIKLTSLFKKNKDKPTEDEPRTKDADPENPEPEPQEAPSVVSESDNRGLVYAELDLVRAEMKPVLKNDDEKTEYAEIVYTPVKEKEKSEEESSPKK